LKIFGAFLTLKVWWISSTYDSMTDLLSYWRHSKTSTKIKWRSTGNWEPNVAIYL